jgi:hypothetical protein
VVDDASVPYDDLLMVFAGVVEKFDLHMAITLSIGGLVIAGNLISTRRYGERMAEEFTHGGGIAPEMARVMSALGILATQDPDDESSLPEPSFLHLEKIKFLAGSPIPFTTVGSGGLWRCRIDRVDGFMFGSPS